MFAKIIVWITTNVFRYLKIWLVDFFLCNKHLHFNFNINFHKRKKSVLTLLSVRSESVCCVFFLYSADSALSWYDFPQKHWITISHDALIALFIMQHFILLLFLLIVYQKMSHCECIYSFLRMLSHDEFCVTSLPSWYSQRLIESWVPIQSV